MRRFPSNWSWWTAAGLSAGLLVLGSNLTQAWQNTGTRQRAKIEIGSNEADRDDEVIRDPDGRFIILPKCTIKLIDSVVLASDRQGIIAFVEPEEGFPVRAQQTVVGLKDEAAQALLDVARKKATNTVNKEFAVASAAVAKAEWEKMLEANRNVPRSVPATEVERARLNYEKAILQGKQADFEREVAELEADKAEAELKAMKIEAPFEGRIRRILKRKGEAVAQGTPIVELVSTRRVKVEGYLPVEDIWKVKKDDLVEVQIDAPGRNLEIAKEVFQGKITYVDPTVGLVTHGARVTAEVDNRDERLIEGLYSKMKIKFAPRGSTAKTPDAKNPAASGIKQAGTTK